MSPSVLLRLGRVSNLPTVWTNVLAASVLARAHSSIEGLALVALAATLFYEGGMFLNDAFDHKYDAEHRAERPIPLGEIRASTVYALGFLLLAGGIAVSLFVALSGGSRETVPTLIWAIALTGVILLYDAFHKNNPLSPGIMALCRVATYGLAGSALGGRQTIELGFGMAAIFGYLVGLTFVAKQENLLSFRGGWPLLFIALPLATLLLDTSLLTAAVACLWLGWTGFSLYPLMTKGHACGPQIPLVVSRLLAGICALDALLCASQGRLVLALVCLAGVPLTRAFQSQIAGT